MVATEISGRATVRLSFFLLRPPASICKVPWRNPHCPHSSKHSLPHQQPSQARQAVSPLHAMCPALCGTLRRRTFWFSTAVPQLMRLSLPPFPSLSHLPASVLVFLGPLPNILLTLNCLTQAVLPGDPMVRLHPAYLLALSLVTLHVATRVASDNIQQSRSPDLLKTSQWLLLTSRVKR